MTKSEGDRLIDTRQELCSRLDLLFGMLPSHSSAQTMKMLTFENHSGLTIGRNTLERGPGYIVKAGGFGYFLNLPSNPRVLDWVSLPEIPLTNDDIKLKTKTTIEIPQDPNEAARLADVLVTYTERCVTSGVRQPIPFMPDFTGYSQPLVTREDSSARARLTRRAEQRTPTNS